MGIFGLAGLIAIAGFVLWIWALVDSLRRPQSEWEAAGQNQLVWVLVIVLANGLGALIYLLVARPSLEQVKAS